MLKAVLRYTDASKEGNKVFSVLSKNNIEILKTNRCSCIYPEITIRISDYTVLNDIVYKINSISTHGVSIEKVKNEKRFKLCGK